MKNTGNQTIAVDGIDLHYDDAGSGNPVFLLQASLKSDLADRLAQGFRVIAFDVRDSQDRQHVGNLLARAANRLGIARYSVIAESELAPAAVAHAIDFSDSVEVLILVGPRMDGSKGAFIDLPLEQVNAPTLVLSGTRDQLVAPETGCIYARRIPKCFYTLVYDAGHDIGADRPQALHAVVRDFLEHREKFVIAHESSVIDP